jgi:D-amino-acid dehydrogenase
MDQTPVTVIGGGIVGICCAATLQREGLKVTVIDPGVAVERCSYGNAGSLSAGSVAPLAMPGVLGKVPGMLLDPKGALRIRPGYLPRVAPWLVRFVRSAAPDRVERASRALHALLDPAIDALLPLARDAGAADLVRRSGQLQLYPSRAAYEADAAGWDLKRARGVRVETVEADEIRQMEPEVGPDYRYGVLLPDEGMVADPQGLLDALAEAFVRDGGRIVRGRAAGFETGPEGPRRVVLDGGETLPAGRVVVAAGAWSHRLAAGLGDRIPLETQRGYHLTLRDPGLSLGRPVVAADRKCFATPMSMGLRLAGTVEFAGLDAPPDRARAEALLDHGRRLFPRLAAGAGSGAVTAWMGHRPCLPDSLPVIGRARRFPSVTYAFGHGHLGLTGAAVTGRHVAALVMGRAPAIDLAPFGPDRFGG